MSSPVQEESKEPFNCAVELFLAERNKKILIGLAKDWREAFESLILFFSTVLFI